MQQRPAVCLLKFVLEKISTRYLGRYSKLGQHLYPDYVKQLTAGLQTSFSCQWFDTGPTVAPPTSTNDQAITVIPLAGEKLVLDHGVIPWQKDFQDSEDVEALHRWHWILRLYSSGKYSPEFLAAWFCAEIERWLDIFLDEIREVVFLDSLHWYPYTVGERISSCCLFFYLAGFRPSEKIVSGLVNQATYLSRCLEFKGPYTGNHVVNNARALYLAGCFCNQPGFRELAVAVFRNEIPKHITADGFFREGSSHYHFLYSRWLLELYYVSDMFKDEETRDFLGPFCEKMIRQCCFFLVAKETQPEWEMPLFGDISPDCPPSWLIDLPFSPLARPFAGKQFCRQPPGLERDSWRGMWKKHTVGTKEDKDCHHSETCLNPDSGWYRLERGGQTLFVRADFQGIPDYVGHHHDDIYHFTLFRKGEPVLIDPGRVTYEKCGNDYLLPKAHNSITIDGLGAFPADRRFLLKEYCQAGNRVIVTPEENENSLAITILSEGFYRLDSHLEVKRKIVVSSEKMTVFDSIRGTGVHVVCCFFHWAPGILLTQHDRNSWLLQTEAGHALFSVKKITEANDGPQIETDVSMAGVCSAYGEEALAPVTRAVARVSLPCQLEFTLEWQ